MKIYHVHAHVSQVYIFHMQSDFTRKNDNTSLIMKRRKIKLWGHNA